MDATFQLEKTPAATPSRPANRSLGAGWTALLPRLPASTPRRSSMPPLRAATAAKRRKSELLPGTRGKIGFLVSHRKQTTVVLSNRDNFGGSFAAEPSISSAKKPLSHLRFSLSKSPKINRQLFHAPPSKFFTSYDLQVTSYGRSEYLLPRARQSQYKSQWENVFYKRT